MTTPKKWPSIVGLVLALVWLHCIRVVISEANTPTYHDVLDHRDVGLVGVNGNRWDGGENRQFRRNHWFQSVTPQAEITPAARNVRV